MAARDKQEKVALRPDGWERFRLAVKAAAKAGPQHRHPKKRTKKRK
jgi:hypothetical protein